MAAARTRERVLSDEDVARVIALVEDVDSVELKLSVPEADQRAVVTALGLDPLDAQIRQVFFLDTPDLALSDHGVVVRARRVQKKGDDSVVKLRPVVPSELPAARAQVVVLRRRAGRHAGRVRVLGVDEGNADRCPGGHGRQAAAAQAVLEGAARCSTPSTRRRASGSTSLSVLGPIFVLKLKFAPPEIGRKMVAELWLYPDGARILELSTKCVPSEAFQVAAEARAFLSSKGVDTGGEQQTKTRKALEFFSGR